MTEDTRTPAPGTLRRVQEFINSEDLEQCTDELGFPDQLTTWLARRDLLEANGQASSEDLTLAREVRAALRELAFANNDGSTSAEAWEILNRASAKAGLQTHFGPDGASLVTESEGVPGALGRLLVDVYAAMQDGTWSRLKACRSDRCRWAFYDRSKNRSGAWCSMAECGNQAKTRAYRQRSKAARTPARKG